MAKKKNKLLNISQKLKFKKPSKHLSNIVYSKLSFKSTIGSFGSYAIQANKSGFMTRGQIEAVRIAFRRPIKRLRNAKVWVLVVVDKIVTKRSAETRMGKGKGAPNSQIALIEKGQLLYEIQGPVFSKMVDIFEKTRKKLPVPVTLIDFKNGKIH